MKVVIIVFSPSGHTLKVAKMIKNQCEKFSSSVNLIDITGEDKFLFENKKEENLHKELGEYDLLFIGGPIYAGHMESNILKTIQILPNPDDTHSNLVVPFLTYGGAHSSIALEEMGALLRKRKHKSILGIKIAATHTLTQTFTKVINPEKPSDEEKELIIKTIDYIFETIKKGKENIIDQSKSFEYSSTKERKLFHSITQEEIHKKHKIIHINQDKCIRCKKCIIACPVNMFDFAENKITMKNNNRCILCAECFHNCPVNAIEYPYMETVRMRLQDGYIPMEKELSAIYPEI